MENILFEYHQCCDEWLRCSLENDSLLITISIFVKMVGIRNNAIVEVLG
jgi:hypothetical protein